MHQNEAQRQIKQHFTSVQIIAWDVICICVITTVCSWLVHDLPQSSLYIFVVTLSLTLSARLRGALSQDRKLLRTFCSRSLQLFHFLFFIIFLASLLHSNYLHSSSVQASAYCRFIMMSSRTNSSNISNSIRVISGFCHAFKLQAVYYLNY